MPPEATKVIIPSTASSGLDVSDSRGATPGPVTLLGATALKDLFKQSLSIVVESRASLLKREVTDYLLELLVVQGQPEAATPATADDVLPPLRQRVKSGGKKFSPAISSTTSIPSLIDLLVDTYGPAELRKTADMVLFTSGFYSESLWAGGLGRPYYRLLGRSAYARLAASPSESKVAPLLRHQVYAALAAFFEEAEAIFADISDLVALVMGSPKTTPAVTSSEGRKRLLVNYQRLVGRDRRWDVWPTIHQATPMIF